MIGCGANGGWRAGSVVVASDTGAWGSWGQMQKRNELYTQGVMKLHADWAGMAMSIIRITQSRIQDLLTEQISAETQAS